MTKIKSTADAIGQPLTIARSSETLLALAAAGANPIIIDMNVTGVDPADVIRQCKARENPPHVIAYLSHVQTELADAARQAGADQVLPRSKFSADLPSILQITS